MAAGGGRGSNKWKNQEGKGVEAFRLLAKLKSKRILYQRGGGHNMFLLYFM